MPRRNPLDADSRDGEIAYDAPPWAGFLVPLHPSFGNQLLQTALEERSGHSERFGKVLQVKRLLPLKLQEAGQQLEVRRGKHKLRNYEIWQKPSASASS